MANIAKNIRLLRTAQKMTQDQLAERLHVTRQTVSNYETGKSQPDIDTIVRLAEALQADPNTLIYGIPTPPARKREYVKTAVIVALVILLAVLALATKGIADENAHNYNGWVRIHRKLYLFPITWLLAGYAFMQVLSLWRGVKPVYCWWIKVLLVAAVLFCLFLAVEVWYISADSGWMRDFHYKIALPFVLDVIWDAAPSFLLPGAALWLFRLKKPKEAK